MRTIRECVIDIAKAGGISEDDERVDNAVNFLEGMQKHMVAQLERDISKCK